MDQTTRAMTDAESPDENAKYSACDYDENNLEKVIKQRILRQM